MSCKNTKQESDLDLAIDFEFLSHPEIRDQRVCCLMSSSALLMKLDTNIQGNMSENIS